MRRYEHRTSPTTIRPTANSQQPTARGFTIIEVMIVLAIAGVIMLLVFEAIPALERNSRNNQRRQDISAILAAVSQYELNNSANFPMFVASPPIPPSPPQATIYPKLTYYDPANVNLKQQNTASPALPTDQNPVTDTEKVLVLGYEKCDPNNQGAAVTQGTDYSNIVALYAVESGGGSTPQCQQL